MDRLEQYRVFVKVADMGSFIKAAHAMEMPRATVSAAIAQLEVAMGVRLLHRTTRQMRLTVDGLQFLDRVRGLLVDAENIDQLFHVEQRAVAGRLNVDVPSRIARRLLSPALPGLFQRYPDLRLGLTSTDRTIDLVQAGVDCAVRVGDLPSSSLAVRPLGRLTLVNCASPAYLRERGHPRSLSDLSGNHRSVGYASISTGRELPWVWDSGAAVKRISVPSRVVVDSAESYIACCLAGLGMIQVPYFDVRHLMESGELVDVFPDNRAPAMDIALVYPHRRQRSRRLVAFMDWFEELIQPHLA